MARVELPISNGFYVDDTKQISNQICVNWVPVVQENNAISIAQLKGTPGISSFGMAGNKVSRGAHVMDSIMYSVNGNALFRVNSDGTTDNLGTISGDSRVSMADNGVQLCVVVPDSTGYIFTQSPNTLTEITDPDYFSLGPSKHVSYKDGFFVHISKTKFFHSALNDGLVYPSLDFGTAEADPDNNTAIHVNRNILYIAGNETIEPFQNIGGSGFVFQRIPGGLVQKGVKAKFSIVDFDNSFVFLGGGVNEQPSIWRFSGASAVRISTNAIDQIIGDLTDAEQQAVFAMTYSEDGGFFVCFKLGGRMMCYDASASIKMNKPIWHERASRDAQGSRTPWRVSGVVEAYGKHLVVDSLSANIGEMSNAILTEYGTNIDRDFSTQPFQNQGKSFFVDELEITCESGPVSTGNPKITLSRSTDGVTFGNELSRFIGKTGERNKRQVWRRLGRSSRYDVYKFSMSDPITPAILKLEADIVSGT